MEQHGTAWKQRDNDIDTYQIGDSGFWDSRSPECAQVRIQIQVQACHLIVRLGGTTRTTDDGFQDPWDHVTDVKIGCKFLEVSSSIIVRVTYYANDGIFRVMVHDNQYL